MKNCHEQVLSALKKLVVKGGISISNDDLNIFEKKPNDAAQHTKRLGEIYNAVFTGFFHCAADGLVFVPEEKVAEEFGNPIEINYPEANEVFLKFAKTYWTLKVLTGDLIEKDTEWIGAHLLLKLEQDIGPVFFPFPGSIKIAPSKRENFQRQLIDKSGANIDIEEFIKGNPILIRDRKSKSRCLGLILLLLSFTPLLSFILTRV